MARGNLGIYSYNLRRKEKERGNKLKQIDKD